MAVSPETQQVLNELRLLTDALKKHTIAQSFATKDMYVYSSTVEDVRKEYDKLEDNLKKQTHLNQESQRAAERLLRAKKAEIDILEKIKKEQLELAAIRKEYANAKTPEEKEEYKVKRQILLQNIKEHKTNLNQTQEEIVHHQGAIKSLSFFSKHLNVAAFALSKIWGAVVAFNTKFLEASHASAGVIEETTGNFDQGMAHWLSVLNLTGVASQQVLKIMTENRQVVNSLGGMLNTIKVGESAIKGTYLLYGSLEEAMKQNLGVMSEFAKKGVRPSVHSLQQYNDDLNMLARLTGMSGDAMNNMINSIADDSDSITLLRAARGDERDAILANQRALLKSNIALGMTAEQATEASKMLNKMVATKPLERLKQAAKIQAMGAALGLGSESEQAAAALRKPKGSQTREDMAMLNEFATKATSLIGSAAQQGLPQEIFTSTLVEKLDLETYFGTGSAFDTNLTETNKSLLDLRNDYKDQSSSIIATANIGIDVAKQSLTALLDGTMILGYILDMTRYIPLAMNKTEKWLSTIISGMGNLIGYFTHSNPFGETAFNMLMESTEGIKQYEDGQKVTQPIVESINAEVRNMVDENKKSQVEATPSPIELSEPTKNSQPTSEDEMLVEYLRKVRTKQIATPDLQPIENVARVKTPGETVSKVSVAADPVKESVEKATADRAESLMSDQVGLLSQHGTKIDKQLQQMSSSNDYLKIIADTNPKILDLAEKQLAAITMTKEQRMKLAGRLRSEDSKFNAAYSYAF